jgi:arylsulfatase A-like enzyme
MAGSTPPAEVDGADLSALLVKRAALPARTIFWDYEGQSAARSGDWKFLTSYREGLGQPMQTVPWLSNLASDPSESRNVASANPEVVARLTDAILTWRAKFK